MSQRIENIRRASIDIINKIENTDKKEETIKYSDLTLEKVTKQYILLYKFYALNENSYKKCIPEILISTI